MGREDPRSNGISIHEDAAELLIRKEVGKVCHRVLSDCGVYKQDAEGKEGLDRFLRTVGMSMKA